MGGSVSDARSNSDLVHKLVESGHLSEAENCRIKEAFNIIDRGKFLSAFENIAYENRSWRSGNDLYLDPAWVHCEVLNALNLKKCDSVLNIGSSVGYFGLVASLLVGHQGKFIGIDHSCKAAHYASTRYENFVERSSSFDMQEFCEPIFLVGDITKFKPGFAKFDKAFCSVAVTVDLLPLFLSFVKVGGILVATIDENLLKCKRLDERRVFFQILSVMKMPFLITDDGSVSDLYPKSSLSELFKESDNGNTVILEYSLNNLPNMFHDSIEQQMWNSFENELHLKPNSLQKLCRGKIRNLIRQKFETEEKQLKIKYFERKLRLNYPHELKRLAIMHYSLTNCCLKRVNYLQANVTSKLNCKFKNYRKALDEIDNDLMTNSKRKLCSKCQIIDQMTLVELEDHEYLKSTHEQYRYYLQNRIQLLALPDYLKRFVNYNREFEFDYENFYA